MILLEKLKRPNALLLAGLLFLATLLPAMAWQKANAYTLLGSRQIKLSSSAAGNAPNSAGTNVTYEVEFELATTFNFEGIVVTFCENTPIIEDTTCDLPAGFSLNSASVSASATLGDINPSTWTTSFEDHATGAPGTFNTLTLSHATGEPGATAGDIVRFDIDGVTNPNAVNTSFYARIYTYDTDSDATAYTLANPNVGGDAIDAGGIAMSTAEQLTITGKVQERLTFCIFVTGNDCSDGTDNSLILGDVNGVLDNDTEYTADAYFGVSTNANGYGGTCNVDYDPDATVCSVAIRMKGGTLKSNPACPDGNGQSCSINPVGGTATTGTTGSEQFGMYVTSAGVPLVATTPYDGGTGTQYAFDDNNTNGTQSTFGDTIATFNASAEVIGTMTFAANIHPTTEPGIYTTTLTFIATGTY